MRFNFNGLKNKYDADEDLEGEKVYSDYLKKSVRTTHIEVDYKLHLNKTDAGLYGLVGIKVTHMYYSVSLCGDATFKKYYSTGYNVGIGYDFSKKLGARIVYNLDIHSIDKVSTALTYTF